MKITMFSSDQTQTRSPRRAADRKHIFRMHRDVRIEMRIVCRVNAQTSRRKSRDGLSFLRSFFLFPIQATGSGIDTNEHWRSFYASLRKKYRWFFNKRGKRSCLIGILVKNLMEEIHNERYYFQQIVRLIYQRYFCFIRFWSNCWNFFSISSTILFE